MQDEPLAHFVVSSYLRSHLKTDAARDEMNIGTMLDTDVSKTEQALNNTAFYLKTTGTVPKYKTSRRGAYVIFAGAPELDPIGKLGGIL
jgi:hypothetical protein